MIQKAPRLKNYILLVVIFSLTACGHEVEKSPGKEDNNKPHDEVIDTVQVQSRTLERTIRIPSEVAAFRVVEIYPKVQGFIKKINVDRGSLVKTGQVLIEIVAPELNANYREAQAKYESINTSLLEMQSKVSSEIAHKEEAEAILAADQANFQRILIAAKTAGAVAPVDIEAAEKKVEGDKAKVRSAQAMIDAARSALEAEKDRARGVAQAMASVKEMKEYLIVKSPFNGVISERNVHEGSLVSSASSERPMLKIEQISRLRILVPVPETAISGVKIGSPMKFSVAAFVGKTFSATISRISHELDRRTRTMLVELDVQNQDRQLEPGMYAEVVWQMSRPYKTLFVPSSCIVNKEDKTYVAKILDNHVRLVPIARGLTMDKLVEIVGAVKEGDQLVLHPSSSNGEGAVRTRIVSLEGADKAEEEH